MLHVKSTELCLNLLKLRIESCRLNVYNIITFCRILLLHCFSSLGLTLLNAEITGTGIAIIPPSVGRKTALLFNNRPSVRYTQNFVMHDRVRKFIPFLSPIFPLLLFFYSLPLPPFPTRPSPPCPSIWLGGCGCAVISSPSESGRSLADKRKYMYVRAYVCMIMYLD